VSVQRVKSRLSYLQHLLFMHYLFKCSVRVDRDVSVKLQMPKLLNFAKEAVSTVVCGVRYGTDQ